MRIVILMILVTMLGLMLAPAVVGWQAGASVDTLGWATYGLLGLKLGLGGAGVIYYCLNRNREEDEA